VFGLGNEGVSVKESLVFDVGSITMGVFAVLVEFGRYFFSGVEEMGEYTHAGFPAHLLAGGRHVCPGGVCVFAFFE